MSGWKEYKLGNFGTVITGKTPSSKNPEDWGDEMLFITPSDYKNYLKYANCSDRKLSSIGANRLNKKILPPNSLLVTCIGSDMGKVVKASDYCITNQQINSIIPNDKFDSDFIYYKLIDLYDTLKIYGGDGTAVPIVNKSDFENIVAEVPENKKEQERIAGVLSGLDDKIDLLTRQNRTLEAMAEIFFRQYFIENPKEDWKDGIIADLIDFNPQRKLSKDTIAPFLEMSSLSTTTYAPNGWYDRAFSSGTKFKNGDTLLARITPCLENGKTAYVDFLEEKQIAWGSTEYIVMCPKGELHPFLGYIVAKYQDFRDYAESCMSGSSGRQRVDINNLKGYEIKIPDTETIKQFNIFIESIVSKMSCNNKQIRSLANLRNVLLPKLMNNEIKI